jgi:hypothetical protein
VTAKNLIAYAIILFALVGVVVMIVRSRRRPASRHQRINITRDDTGI